MEYLLFFYHPTMDRTMAYLYKVAFIVALTGWSCIMDHADGGS